MTEPQTTAAPTLPELLDVQAVASWLGLSPCSIYRGAESGRIPAFKVCRTWRFSRDELLAWLERRRPRRQNADERALRRLRRKVGRKGAH